MQIGMVGSDGVILASDTRCTHPPKTGESTAKRYGSDSKKIKIDHAKGIAVSLAGDMIVASSVADMIIAEWQAVNLRYPEDSLERIGQLVPQQDRHGAQCFVALACSPKPRLFTFEFGELEAGWHPCCQEESSKTVAGDTANASVFWAERYYPKFRSLHLTVQQLVPLAAHLIVSAAHLNTKEVDGLDIVICEATGIRRLTDKSIDELVQNAGEWDEAIGALFLSHRQEYQFLPNEREGAL